MRNDYPEPPAFEPGQEVLVRRVAAWPGQAQPLAATIVRKTPQFGDCYLVRYADGRQDVIQVGRITTQEVDE